MSRELPEAQRALPVLKVLYRNTNHIQQMGGRVARGPAPGRAAPPRPAGGPGAEALREATRRQDMDGAERTFAALAHGPLDEAYNDLQYLVQDNINVHRVVLAWRSWALLDFTGKEHAHTLLRQSVRFCVDEETNIRKYTSAERAAGPPAQAARRVPAWLSRAPGDRQPDDAWVEQLSQTIYASDRRAGRRGGRRGPGRRDRARGHRRGDLAGRQPARPPRPRPRARRTRAAKPKGSVHGASVGVHASDAANAWRNIARVSNRRNTLASLIVGAYHTAGQSGGLNPQPYPFAEHREKVRDVAPDALLPEAEAAIKANDQARACALVHRYGELGRPARPVFDLLLRYAISEDGALHAEKYYRTVTEEFATTRPAFRWRQLAALRGSPPASTAIRRPASPRHAGSSAAWAVVAPDRPPGPAVLSRPAGFPRAWRSGATEPTQFPAPDPVRTRGSYLHSSKHRPHSRTMR